MATENKLPTAEGSPERLVMLHWEQGGTGITNFAPKSYPAYEAALAETLADDLIIVSRPIGIMHMPGDYSLHFRPGRPHRDLSAFWRVFEKHKHNAEVSDAARHGVESPNSERGGVREH